MSSTQIDRLDYLEFPAQSNERKHMRPGPYGPVSLFYENHHPYRWVKTLREARNLPALTTTYSVTCLTGGRKLRMDVEAVSAGYPNKSSTTISAYVQQPPPVAPKVTQPANGSQVCPGLPRRNVGDRDGGTGCATHGVVEGCEPPYDSALPISW